MVKLFNDIKRVIDQEIDRTKKNIIADVMETTIDTESINNKLQQLIEAKAVTHAIDTYFRTMSKACSKDTHIDSIEYVPEIVADTNKALHYEDIQDIPQTTSFDMQPSTKQAVSLNMPLDIDSFTYKHPVLKNLIIDILRQGISMPTYKSIDIIIKYIKVEKPIPPTLLHSIRTARENLHSRKLIVIDTGRHFKLAPDLEQLIEKEYTKNKNNIYKVGRYNRCNTITQDTRDKIKRAWEAISLKSVLPLDGYVDIILSKAQVPKTPSSITYTAYVRKELIKNKILKIDYPKRLIISLSKQKELDFNVK